jgi:pseudouridine-5'-phosphate glycosidase
LTGATTVAGTMVFAHAAGIPVFVTGGIGGVHRGSEHSMLDSGTTDLSALSILTTQLQQWI